jgi:hypothetical protein
MRQETTDLPPFVKPHLDVKLKPGWAYDPKRGVFVSEAGEEHSPGESLPEGSRIVPMAPALAEADPRSLSPAERDLARYFQVILPRGEDPAEHGKAVGDWESVAEVQLPPKPGLPGMI